MVVVVAALVLVAGGGVSVERLSPRLVGNGGTASGPQRCCTGTLIGVAKNTHISADVGSLCVEHADRVHVLGVRAINPRGQFHLVDYRIYPTPAAGLGEARRPIAQVAAYNESATRYVSAPCSSKRTMSLAVEVANGTALRATADDFEVSYGSLGLTRHARMGFGLGVCRGTFRTC